jgi:hypothetical protein
MATSRRRHRPLSKSIEKQAEAIRARKSPVQRVQGLCLLAEAAAKAGKPAGVLKEAVAEALAVDDESRESLIDTVVETQAKLGYFSEAIDTTLSVMSPEGRGKCYDTILRRAKHRANAIIVSRCRDGIKSAQAQMTRGERQTFEDYLRIRRL